MKLLILIIFNLILISLGQRCYEEAIKDENTISAAQCVAKDPLLISKRKTGDPYSRGNLDDFCLRFGISDVNGNSLMGVSRSYEGIGKIISTVTASSILDPQYAHLKNFRILEKLVQGNTWSYQSEGNLENVNLDFDAIRQSFEANFKLHVTNKRQFAAAKQIEIDAKNISHWKYTQAIGPGTNLAERSKAIADKYEDDRIAIQNSCAGSCSQVQLDQINILADHRDRERRKEVKYQLHIDAFSRAEQAKMCQERNEALKYADEFEQIFLPLKSSLGNLDRFPSPNYLAPNPYFVEVSAIKIDGAILKNYLHIRVFLNRSVSDERNRPGKERYDKSHGRIKGFLLMVKDQDGWPVGDFSHAIPCKKTCSKYGIHVHTHDERNDLPCSYTPPVATTHPGLFVWPSDDQDKVEGAREIHATWSFAQDSCNFVTELHFQALIIEDFVLRPGSDFTTRTHLGASVPIFRDHFFGWTARYNILHPTRNSLGATDYVSLKKLQEKYHRTDANTIDCHVPLEDSFGFIKGKVPNSPNDIPTHVSYFHTLMSEFPVDKFAEVHYFGQHLFGHTSCRDPVIHGGETNPAKSEIDQLEKRMTFQDLLKSPEFRCPCPALELPTDSDTDQGTVSPNRQHGRLLHASHMAMAWIVLVPLAFFVVRFYKETYQTVFCFQEYWWFMWHVVVLFLAAAYNYGGILAITPRKNGSKLVTTGLPGAHSVMGIIAICIFFIQLVAGFFRPSNIVWQRRAICVHWFVGIVNHILALFCVFLTAFVKRSGMSCNAVIVTCGWLIFYLIMLAIMECNLRSSDRLLNLDPPRSYLPPPLIRIFGRDAPGSKFRLIMLGMFIIATLIFYWVLITCIWNSNGKSCVEELNGSKSKPGSDSVEIAEEVDYFYHTGDDS